jgi:hypothetical protein
MTKISKEKKTKKRNNQRISRVINEMKNNGNIKMANVSAAYGVNNHGVVSMARIFCAQRAARSARIALGARARLSRACERFAQPRCRQAWKK